MSNVTSISSARPRVLEFFAGIGLARLGLESAGFSVAWSNDFEADKRLLYESHFGASAGDHSFHLGDIGAVSGDDLPPDASLAWASSPCTDLSLAGSRAGLAGTQSGTFWQFIRVLEELQVAGTLPSVAVLENVTGLSTSHGGDDLTAAIRAFNGLGYVVDVLSLDARRFLPQSRPRLFIVALSNPLGQDDPSPTELRPDWLQWVFQDPSLLTHRTALPPVPPPLSEGFGSIVETMPDADNRWWEADRVSAFRSSLSPIQAQRLTTMKLSSSVQYRTAYRRTRNGVAVWEMRPDDIAGCLRTARGGSSKQAVVKLGNDDVKIRWMTPLEYARLMGAGDFDFSAANTNKSLFGFGDAVAVPVVAWLAKNYLLPAVRRSDARIPEATAANS